MRRSALLLALPLALAAPSASAREQAPCAQASVTRGPAPLAVSFAAACDAAAFHWDFGDGSAADGTTASHTFAAGRFGVTLTVTQADGSTATERVGVDSIAVVLSSRRVGPYGRPALFAGRIVPTERGTIRLYRAGRLVNSARVKSNGSFRMRTRLLAPGPWQARSPAVSVLVRPRLVARFEGSGAVRTPLALVARLVPARAGQIEVRIWRNGTLRVVKTYARGARIPLGTGETATYRVSVASVPAAGFARASRVLSTRLFLPT